MALGFGNLRYLSSVTPILLSRHHAALRCLAFCYNCTGFKHTREVMNDATNFWHMLGAITKHYNTGYTN